MEQLIDNIALRVHDLENEFCGLRDDMREIRKIMSRIYLLGWGCFVAMLGVLSEVLVRR